MNSEIIPIRTPEEEELERKRSELAALEDQLSERELELATLRAELDRVEHAYMASVGVKYAELDRIEARIAELLAAGSPDNGDLKVKAAEARQRAEESAQATHGIKPEAPQLQRFTPSDSLKRLFRQAAKVLHPDLAETDEDRVLRTRLMAEVNEAYAIGDEDRIRDILRDWEVRPESVAGEGTMADLQRVLRKLAQVRRRLRAIDDLIVKLNSSHANRLKEQLDQAAAGGRDLLAELSERVTTDIEAAQQRLRTIEQNG